MDLDLLVAAAVWLGIAAIGFPGVLIVLAFMLFPVRPSHCGGLCHSWAQCTPERPCPSR